METCGLYKCLGVKYSKYDNKIYRLVDIFDTENNIVEIDSESLISLLKTDVIAIMNIYINDEHEIEINQNSVDRIESILKFSKKSWRGSIKLNDFWKVSTLQFSEKMKGPYLAFFIFFIN